jgi:hypothetical protein
MESNLLRLLMLYAGQRSLRLRRSGSRLSLVRGVEYGLCEKTQKVGLHGSIFHLVHQVHTIYSHLFHRPKYPLYIIHLEGRTQITTQ